MLEFIERMVINLGEAQTAWLYLMPVFASKVLLNLSAGARFVQVDKLWREAMAVLDTHQEVVSAIEQDALATDALVFLVKELDQVKADLSAYLEDRRLQFTRFYFLSNDELYSILAEAEDPLRVQPVSEVNP
jgi:dynein heavy chain, axonemal